MFLKKFSLIIFLIYASSHIVCQVTPLEEMRYRNQFDELLNSDLADSIKLQFLIDSIGTIDVIYSRLPFIYANKGITLANSESKWRGELYLILGRLYSHLGEKDSAQIATEKALSDYKTIENTSKVLDAHYTLSQMYGANNSSDKSLEHSYAAIAICEKSGDKDGLALSHLHIAGNLYNFGEPQRAIGFAEKALGFYKESENLYGQFDTYAHLAAYHTDSLDLALFNINEGLAIIKDNPQFDKNAWIHFYCTRIIVYERMGLYERIENDLNVVDSLAGDNQGLTMRFFLDFKKAVTKYQLGRYKESSRLFLKNINGPLISNNPYK